jgi:predicted amidohydrolase
MSELADLDQVSEKLGVAVVQLTSANSVKSNEATVRQALVEIAARGGTKLVVLPENVWFLRLVDGEQLPDFSDASDFHREIQDWVEKNDCAVVFGAVPVSRALSGEMKPFAATVVFEPGKQWHVPYTKVHLFDVDVAGHKPVRESDHLIGGMKPMVWSFRGWKFGCAICYDVRFAELFSVYAKQAVDAIFLPSAFLVPTGRQHWEILVRARAIESQAYLLAPAHSGDHIDQSGRGASIRKTYGRSMVIDPWGRILGAAQVERSGTEILYAELSRDEISKVRTQIPMKDHRRL